MTFAKLINSLHAADQRRSMRDGGDQKFENALVIKSSYQKGKEKLVKRNHCHKNGHEKLIVGIKERHNAKIVKDLGTWLEIAGSKMMRKKQ